ncbi:ABC transporter permease [candidate division WWE3 bacterium]|uniref:Transport permease protein n=1 Tax=candidate division WWE3 bacterium TaxID=2053526 RepID=A0A955LGZ7_UNCKA|nr:ABC transporter permease [candidate division WWE3 bacterium]
MKREISAILIIALRDFLKFLRDRSRIAATFIFPILFIGALGGSLQSNWGDELGFNITTFIFTGVLGQTLFQSAAAGVISLIEDRQNDFSREMFVSPISRYSIIIGKIFGESIVALIQGVGIIVFGFIIRIPLSFHDIIWLLPFSLVVCFMGGAFGVLVLSNLSSERAANQIFPFLIFPQFFLAGVFNPIRELPTILDVLSRISPMRYAVDLIRGIYYAGRPEYGATVLNSVGYNLAVCGLIFGICVIVGTYLFINNERNQ